jgi:hypothetical protein
MTEPRYQRLTRSRPRASFGVISTSRSCLWLGEDHLLAIDTSGYTETYKRFYFRDIQAFVLRQSRHWIVWGVVFGVLASAFGLFAIVNPIGEALARWILGCVAAVFLMALLLDLAAGPSCVCHVRTAVQTEELPSLNRLRRARRVLHRLRPLIVAAQGQLAPEEIAARLRETDTPLPPVADGPTATPALAEDPNVPPKLA